MKSMLLLSLLLVTLTGCAPEVGSERWCDMMKETPKGDWTANDAGIYTKSCVLGMRE